MIYLLWGLTNLALVILFIIVCFRAARLVKASIGKPAALLFVVGLISLSSRPSDNNDEPKQVMHDQDIPNFSKRPDSLRKDTSGSLEILLQDNFISKYFVDISYGVKAPENENVPYSAFSGVEGFTCGIEWKPMRIEVRSTADNNRFEYSVYGEISWRLLGLQIAQQGKNFEGYANLK